MRHWFCLGTSFPFLERSNNLNLIHATTIWLKLAQRFQASRRTSAQQSANSARRAFNANNKKSFSQKKRPTWTIDVK